jgi:hypothetical protein
VVDAFDRVVQGVALDDDDAGGNLGALAMVSDTLGYVVVSDASFNSRVVAFDPASGRVLRTLWQTTDLIPDIEVDTNGILAVPDRSFFAPRLCLYRVPAADDEVETALGCANTELPLFSIEALD